MIKFHEFVQIGHQAHFKLSFSVLINQGERKYREKEVESKKQLLELISKNIEGNLQYIQMFAVF